MGGRDGRSVVYKCQLLISTSTVYVFRRVTRWVRNESVVTCPLCIVWLECTRPRIRSDKSRRCSISKSEQAICSGVSKDVHVHAQLRQKRAGIQRPRVPSYSTSSRPAIVPNSSTTTQLDPSEFTRYDISVLLAEDALKHGQDGMHSLTVGKRDWVSVFSPQLAKDVLTNKQFDKVTVLDELKSAYKNGVLVRSFQESIERRKALQPIFSSVNPDVLFKTFSSTALDVCDRIHQSEGQVSLEPMMQGLALDSLSKSLLNYDTRLRFGEMQGALEAIDFVVKEASRRTIVSGAHETNTELETKLDQCKEMVESLLQTAVDATEAGDGSIVDMLTQKNDDPQAMAEDALNLVYNATHTSGAALSWCLFCLA